MNRRKVLAALAGAAVLLAIAQMTAIYFYDLHKIEWFFTPSHFLGGVCVGLFFGYVAAGLGVRYELPACLLIVLMIGISWEVLEYVLDLSTFGVDTMSDIVADLVGGYAAWRYIRSISHS